MPAIARIVLGWYRFLFRKKSAMALSRLQTCLPCRLRRGRFCGECFCELDAKAEVEEEECPKGFWKMRLCAIYNVWDDWDWFQESYTRMRPLVGGVICVWSERSNYGEVAKTQPPQILGVTFVQCEPSGKDVRASETRKRNEGLRMAKHLSYTHFIMMDADEIYEPTEFLKEKDRFNDPSLIGLVCRVKCYFKSPSLTIGYDTTLVPFIHRLEGISCEFNRDYPFAWSDEDGKAFTVKKRIRIDPTRSLNISKGVEWSDITMHHYSWVRRDIKKKVRNSTARSNIERSTIVQDYRDAKEGYFCHFYSKVLQVTPDIFGLPEINDTDIQLHSASAGTDRTT